MNCPECGQEGRSKFCTRCGAHLVQLVAQTHETPHFRIHFPPDSFAAHNLHAVERRLENAYERASTLLEVDMDGNPVNVYLSELVVHSQGDRLVSAGYAVPSRRQIHDVYRPDAPGESLERSFVTLLLATAVENDRPLPPRIVDGLVCLVAQRRFGSVEAGDTTGSLAEMARQRQLPPILSLLDATMTGPSVGVPDSQDIAVSTGLVRYLLRRYGVGRFKELVRLLQSTNPRQAARIALGRRLEQLDEEWRAALVADALGPLIFIRKAPIIAGLSLRSVFEALLSGLASAAALIAGARAIGLAVDRTAVGHDRNGLYSLVALLLGSVLLLVVAGLRQTYVVAGASQRMQEKIHFWMFERVRLSPGIDVSRLAADVDALQRGLSTGALSGLRTAVLLLAAPVAILFLSWKLAVVTLALLPLVLACRLILPSFRTPAPAQQNVTASAALEEARRIQHLSRRIGGETSTSAMYIRTVHSLTSNRVRPQLVGALSSLTERGVALALLCVVFAFGSWLAAAHDLSAGALVTCLILASVAVTQTRTLLDLLQNVEEGAEALDRVQRSVRAPVGCEESKASRRLPPLARAIRLEGVSADPADGQMPVRNLNMTFPAGATVALVGGAGSGASSAVDLILRALDADHGRITFDGVDIRDAAVETLRTQIGVAREEFLPSASIRDNLLLVHPDASDADIEAAIHLADAHQLIAGLPAGYDTVVGDAGSGLSALLRRRLTLARALLRNPPTLLVDEITTGLDSAAQSDLFHTLERVGRGRLMVLVTSNVAAAAYADRIYVMDRGAVVEQGMHDDLVRRDTLYARLWREQERDVIATGSTSIRVTYLQRIPLFATLPSNLHEVIAEQMTFERVRAGELIARQGDFAEKLFIVHHGMLEVLASDPALEHRTLARLCHGDVCGEMALLYGAVQTGAIRAATPVELYSLSRLDFFRLAGAVPELEQRLRHVMAERTQVTSHRDITHLSASRTVRLPRTATG